MRATCPSSRTTSGSSAAAIISSSRIDSAVDKQLDDRIAKANDPTEKERLAALKGKIAIANAKLAYQDYKRLFAGARWDKVEIHALVQAVVVTDDRPAAAAAIAQRTGIGVADALSTPFLCLGSHAEIAEHLLACRERWGFSYFSVRDAAAFAPVMARLRAAERGG